MEASLRYLPHLMSRPHLLIWELPVAIAPDGGQLFTLRELVASKPAIKTAEGISREEWHQLVLEQFRIMQKVERKREEDGSPVASMYQFSSKNGLVRNSTEAIREIEMESTLGVSIVEDQRDYLLGLVGDVYATERVPEKS